MEPVEASLKINYTVMTKVLKVEERTRQKYISGFGGASGDPIKSSNPAQFKTVSEGWFVHFDGSYEAIYFGETQPRFAVGDTVKITFEKVT